LKTASFTLSENLIKAIKETSKSFGLTKSKLVRDVFEHLTFLYNFMDKYMSPIEDKDPTPKELARIELIGELIKWV